ncbi:MAG: hypothetical protein Q7U58_11495 [Hydrogenophaga sp.]|nr:hypothetical protein [Hydrogenophaga sp.]
MSMVHPMARTTPRTRAEIHESQAGLAEVAQTYNISRGTARKWRNRSDHLDRSHRAHQLPTTLSPAQEVIVMEIRRLCLLPLDDLVSVTREFINADASRSGISRLLRREGLSKLADLQPVPQGEEAPKKTFKDYEPGYLHIDIKYLPKMPDESARRYLYVAIDRATRWVFLRTYRDQTERSSVDFLRRVHKATPFKITKLFISNAWLQEQGLLSVKDLWCKAQGYTAKKGKASSSVPTWLFRPLRTRTVGGGGWELETPGYPIMRFSGNMTLF